MSPVQRLHCLKRERVLKSSRRETVDFSLRELVCNAIAGICIFEDIIKQQISIDEEDSHDLQVASDKIRASLLEVARRAENQQKGKNAESKEEEAIMPAGPGTYGKKRGRPPKKKNPTKKTTKKTTNTRK